MIYPPIQAHKLTEYDINYNLTPSDFHEAEVTYHKLTLTKPFELSQIGDIHPFAKTFDQEFYEYSLNRVEKRKNGAMIKKGDVLELNTKDSPGASMHEQKGTNQEQQDYIIKENRKLANDDKIWAIEGGNHDADRSDKLIGIPKSRDIAQMLNVPYVAISGAHIIDFNGHRLIIYGTHGKGRTTGTKNGTRRKLLRESKIYPETDIVCIGHTHRLEFGDLWDFEEVNHGVYIDPETMTFTTKPLKPTKYLITGHFLGYLKSYGQKAGYPPIPAGYPIIQLNTDGSYQVKFIYESDFREGIL